MTAAFSVSEVVTAARCPRQLVLARDGRRVVPVGASAVGQAAHAVLVALVDAAPLDAGIAAALAPAKPDAEAVAAACYRAAFPESHRRARQIAAEVDGVDLARLDGIVRDTTRLLGTLLARARGATKKSGEAIAKALLASETEASLELEGAVVRGRIDLLCRDLETRETWIWDLKTYAGTDAAQAEHVRVYALAHRPSDPKAPALLHVTEDRVQIARARAVDEIDLARLGARVREMTAWLAGAPPPPPAPDRNTCRACPAQEACWARWGRTLAEDDALEGGARAGPPGRTAPGLGPPDRSTLPFVGFAPALFARAAAARTPVEPPPLWIGQLEQGRSNARLEPTDLTRHIAVLGAPGAGKTHFAKSVVEEAVLAGVPALIFDDQGDLAQLAAADPAAPSDLAPRRDAYVERAEVRLFTPGSDAGLRVSLDPLWLPDASLDDAQRAFCLGAIADNLLAPLGIPSSWRSAARSFLLQQLEAAAAEAKPIGLDQLVDRLRASKGQAAAMRKNQRQKLFEQMRLLTTGAAQPLHQGGRALDIDALVRSRAPGRVPVNIVWLKAIADQETKERLVGIILAQVYAWMVSHPSSEPQLLLHLDEVAPYIPPAREPASKAILKRLLKDGRRYGVCGLFCAQDVTDVDYKVFSQANTVVLGRVDSSRNRDKARKILQDTPDFDAQGATDRLAGAPAGRFLVKCPDRFPAPRWLQGRKLLSRHGQPWTESEIRAHVSDALRAWWSRPTAPAG